VSPLLRERSHDCAELLDRGPGCPVGVAVWNSAARSVGGDPQAIYFSEPQIRKPRRSDR